MKPSEANALFVLGKLNSYTIVELANVWIDAGIYSESLGELCTIKDPIMSEVGPIFQSAVKELGVGDMTKMDAAQLLVRTTLERISAGCPNPVQEAEFLYWEIHHEIMSEFSDRKYVGDSLGLEYVFCWLREIWDCRDGSMLLYHADLPRAEAEVKFIEHLREAAAQWKQDTQQVMAHRPA